MQRKQAAQPPAVAAATDAETGGAAPPQAKHMEAEEGLLLDKPAAAAGDDARRAAARIPAIVIVYGIIAALANSLFGIETSVISISKLYLAPEFGIDATSPAYGAVAAANAIGATFGAALAGWPQDFLGRRITLVLACCIYGGAVTVSITAASFAQLFAGRIATGLAIGLFSSTAPMYIAELAPPSIRGTLVTVNQVCICSGILLGYAVGKQFGTNWRYMLASGLPIAAALLLAFVFVTPFSPRWLVTKGRSDEARKVLLRIRTTHAASDDGDDAAGGRSDVDAELAGIEQAVADLRQVSRTEVFAQPWVRWAVFMGVMLSFMQQWTGCNAVNAYAPDVLKDAGFSSSDSIMQSINIGVVKLLFVMVALAAMDKLGRRLLLLVGTGGMAISLACLSTALLIKANPYFTAGSLFLYMAFFEISLGPVMWLLLSELYPLSVRGLAMSIGSTACWANTAAVSFLYPSMSASMGTSGTFFLFFAVCVASWLWMLRYIPETKGKTLEQIEVMLQEGKIK